MASSTLGHAAGLAGHDPVSYFTDAKPLRGSASVTAKHASETYRFASETNRARFVAAPERYLPQYGGHCAWAVAQGELAPADALVYRVVEGKLYLNFNRDVAARWEKDIPGFIRAADAKWPALMKK